MEFVQFTPTALAYPEALAGTSTGGVLLGLEGTRLWNSRQERFMERYDAVRREASTRAILSRAIQAEVVEGRGSPHGGVYLDLTRNDAQTLERLAAPFMKKLAPHGIDIRRDPIEIAPAVHYFMGGVEIDRRAQTRLPGLYAAGEVAGGVQGSNRLSSNSLSDVNVFGRIAGGEAAAQARSILALPAWEPLEQAARDELGETLRPHAERDARRLSEMHGALKHIMFAHAGLVREAAAMQRGVEEIARLRRELEGLIGVDRADLKGFYEMRNMLDVAEAVTRSAMHRKESRGAHSRADYPEKDDARWRVAIRTHGMPGALQTSEKILQPTVGAVG